jgi:pyrroloquinoline quinone (PQQ) biosynthesis protein C
VYEAKSFELSLRKQIDAKYEREASPDNPFARLLAGELPREECQATFGGMLGSLLNFNQVLLPRLLRHAPNVGRRVELMSVIAQEFGNVGPKDAHPTFFLEFLTALGMNVDAAAMEEALRPDAVRAEAEYLRSLTFVELLARILVGETLGPKVFLQVGEALQKSYDLTPRAVLYFTLHAKHDKKDAEILFDMLSREARTDEDRERVVKMIDSSYDFGRYAQYGCALKGIDYSFTRIFDRRASHAPPWYAD